MRVKVVSVTFTEFINEMCLQSCWPRICLETNTFMFVHMQVFCILFPGCVCVWGGGDQGKEMSDNFKKPKLKE